MKRTRTAARAGLITTLVCLVSLVSTRAEAGPCEAEPTDMSVNYGEQVTCDITPATDTDLYRFSGTAGDRVLAEVLYVSGTGFIPRIKLIAPDGAVLEDTWGPARSDRILPQTGTYSVIVSAHLTNGSGNYSVLVSCTAGSCVPTPPLPPPPPPGGDVACEAEPTDFFPNYGTRVTCDITPATDTDLYRFYGNSGDRILAEGLFVSGTGFIPRIKLIAPNGAVLEDTWGPARADLILPQTGVYTAIISAHLVNGAGVYAFTVSCTAGKCLSPLGSPSVTFSLTGCTECQAGQAFTVSAHWRNPGTTTVKAELKLGFRAPNGTTSNSLGNKHLEFTFPANFDINAVLLNIPWPAGQPVGQWSIEAVLLSPDLGETFAREVKFFTVKP